MYKYKHVCTMSRFSRVHTDLPYPVQVVRIPDAILNLVISLSIQLGNSILTHSYAIAYEYPLN